MQLSVPWSRASSVLDLLRAGLARLGSYSGHRIWHRRRKRLRLCETLSLGNRGYLAVVRYQEQQFLVGGTNSSISLIAQLETPRLPGIDPARDDDPAR